jgi:glycosyltransferase involved in cell wall biosynthesis
MYKKKMETWRGKKISLILPTYNERDSIRKVIESFSKLNIIDEIIVINNNATEGTTEEIAKTKAKEIHEIKQGYGAAILRGFFESKGDLIAVCEPDDTFVAKDIFKLLAYADSFDVVYGSRTMNDMIWDGANMGWFLRFGNWSVAKLMQVLFNTCTLTDVGCTFRMIHRESMMEILEKSQVNSNFFGPEMMLISVLMKMKIVQIPINYRERIGISSVTGSLRKTIILGIQMIFLIISVRLFSIKNKSYIKNKIGIYSKRNK